MHFCAFVWVCVCVYLNTCISVGRCVWCRLSVKSTPRENTVFSYYVTCHFTIQRLVESFDAAVQPQTTPYPASAKEILSRSHCTLRGINSTRPVTTEQRYWWKSLDYMDIQMLIKIASDGGEWRGGGQRLEYEKEDNINSIMKWADGKCCLAMTVDISLWLTLAHSAHTSEHKQQVTKKK